MPLRLLPRNGIKCGFNQKLRIHGPWAGVREGGLMSVTACSNLEGGWCHLFEGLDIPDIPCTGRLSVAGFFALLGRFLCWERFILRGERHPLSPGDPLPFNPVTKSGVSPSSMPGMYHCWSWTEGGMYTMVHLPRVYGRHIAQYTSLLGGWEGI